MAEDKKPKIDLKSRLQKMGGPAAAAPPPATTGSVPVPSMVPPAPRTGSSLPGPASLSPPGLSRPAVSGRPPPALDPANPLAAVAQPFRPSGGPAVPALAQPQRIEMDEGVVHQARSGAFKRGLMAGIVFGAVLLVLGYVGGNASSQSNARAQGVRDAHDLAADLTKAKDSLDQLKDKVQAGGKALIGERKFPADLAQQLAGMNVDFAGDKLFGRRFSGVPADVTRNLFDFIGRVQSLNDRKDLIVTLLNKLQKPITEELARPAGQLPISYVAVVDKDTPGSGAFLAPLATPIAPDDKNGVPNDLTFLNPRGSGNVKLPRLQSEKIPKEGAAITIVPNTFEKVCPSATRGQIAQLVSSMNSLVDDIQGQKSSEGADVITESKPGLAETAAKLSEQLNKVD
ncbi:MAG: hypothetical protein ABSC94_28080 [Polyangiaceae bacterium]|jgi:hypothetical protein